MLPDIGMMIGAYIIARMFEMIAKKETEGAMKFVGVVTVVITIVCLYDLMSHATITPAPQ